MKVRLLSLSKVPVRDVKQEDHYYPFGLNISALSSTAPLSKPNNFKYSGKEEQTEFDLNWYDYGARNYDAQIGRFIQVDPLADNRDWLTPYQYGQNNPITRIDPNGMLDVHITGDASEKAMEELQKSTSLRLTRNSKTGKVSASGEAKTKSDEKLLEAIKSTTINVNLRATTKKKLDNGQILADGPYLGNEIDNYGQLAETGSTLVTANQAVNPEATSQMDDFYKKPGANVLHEVLEAFIGGEKALSTGVNGSPSTNYQDVHSETSLIAPQSGPAYQAEESGVILYFVGDGKTPATTRIYNRYDTKKKKK
jgi:RHS repeat-associated protein